MARSKKAQAAIDGALSLAAPTEQVGLGVDIVDVKRVRLILKRTPSFKEKVFSEEEIRYCQGKADPAIHFAARFAAKEAVVKALGTGFSQGIAFKDVEVERNSKGRPSVVVSGNARKAAEELGVTSFALSLSHTSEDAVACAIAITEGSTAAAKKRVDPTVELAGKFKELKSMFDEVPEKVTGEVMLKKKGESSVGSQGESLSSPPAGEGTAVS